MERDLAPDDSKTPRAGGLAARILLALLPGTVNSDALREAFGVRGRNAFHQRLNELVRLGWVEHTVTLTEGGRAAIERMHHASKTKP